MNKQTNKRALCVRPLGTYLDHGGHRVDAVHVLDDALGQVGHTQADGPVGVSLQLDHLVCTATQREGSSVKIYLHTAALGLSGPRVDQRTTGHDHTQSVHST